MPINERHAPGASGPDRLVTFDFLALCALVFLTYCNTTVFYSLDAYLGQIGLAQSARGFLIGSSALATITAYALHSPFMTPANAIRNAALGAIILLACGAGYLHAGGFFTILAVRVGTGAGVYLLSAAVMTLFVGRIPPSRSGQAFGLYSVAVLLPYSTVPAVFDSLGGGLPFNQGYLYTSLSMLPALALIAALARRGGGGIGQARRDPVGYAAMLRDVAEPQVGLLLCLSMLYITVFSSVFFLSREYFQSRGLGGVGLFFSIQMACMIGLRLLGNRIFDSVRKMVLTAVSFTLTGTACLLMTQVSADWQAHAVAVVMGLGMGLGNPAMNALMFLVSEPRFKGVNSNLMTMALQMGNFLGPMLGSVAAHAAGYTGFLVMDAAVCAVAVAICLVFMRKGLDKADPAAG